MTMDETKRNENGTPLLFCSGSLRRGTEELSHPPCLQSPDLPRLQSTSSTPATDGLSRPPRRRRTVGETGRSGIGSIPPSVHREWTSGDTLAAGKGRWIPSSAVRGRGRPSILLLGPAEGGFACMRIEAKVSREFLERAPWLPSFIIPFPSAVSSRQHGPSPRHRLSSHRHRSPCTVLTQSSP